MVFVTQKLHSLKLIISHQMNLELLCIIKTIFCLQYVLLKSTPVYGLKKDSIEFNKYL